jgi:hypothetical protein
MRKTGKMILFICRFDVVKSAKRSAEGYVLLLIEMLMPFQQELHADIKYSYYAIKIATRNEEPALVLKHSLIQIIVPALCS